MKMLPEEAINAATLNGAYAMGLGKAGRQHHHRQKSQPHFYKTHSIHCLHPLFIRD